MKAKSMIKLFLSLSVISSSFVGAIASDAVLNSDPIDINGYVSEPMATDSELEAVKADVRKSKSLISINKEKTKSYKNLGRNMEKLLDVTEEAIEEANEANEIKAKYSARIDCLMKKNEPEECAQYRKTKKDTVSTKMAAPAPQVVAEVKSVKSKDSFGEEIKILPYGGYTSIQSENEDLSAEVSAGLRIESNVSSRFSIGIGFNYMNLTTSDCNNCQNFYYGNYRRDIEYTSYSFDFYSKFYLTKTERFRPYLGAGIGYSRTSAKYTDSNRNNGYNYNYNNYNNNYRYNKEELTTSIMGMRIMGGTEILFTENVGANVELQYSRGIGSGFNEDETDNHSTDLGRLTELSDEINEANIFSVSVGVLVLF